MKHIKWEVGSYSVKDKTLYDVYRLRIINGKSVKQTLGFLINGNRNICQRIANALNGSRITKLTAAKKAAGAMLKANK